MYVIFNFTTHEARIYKEKRPLAKFLGVHFNTVSNNLANGDWIKGDLLIKQPEFIQKKSKRGSKHGKLYFKPL